MSKRETLYEVIVYRGRGSDRTEEKVYQTTNKTKAEKFLHDFIKAFEDDIIGACIQSKPLKSFNKRNYDFDEDF